jgi:baculoviral IAP repeat-containing protein 6
MRRTTKAMKYGAGVGKTVHCIAQDLRELDRQHGRNHVCLRLRFKRGLHPFFPPQVQLLRPRIVGPVPGALASHPMLQLSTWDPWRSQRDLLEQLCLFLEVCLHFLRPL